MKVRIPGEEGKEVGGVKRKVRGKAKVKMSSGQHSFTPAGYRPERHRPNLHMRWSEVGGERGKDEVASALNLRFHR